MDFLSNGSPSIHDNALNLFEDQIYTDNFQIQNDIIIQPTAPPGDTPHASYTFKIGSKEDAQYTIPESVKLFGRVRVCLPSGLPLNDEVLSPVTNFPEAIFKHISVSLNGVNVSDHGRGYHYKSFITKKLSLKKSTKASTLLSNYWQEDELDTEIKINTGS